MYYSRRKSKLPKSKKLIVTIYLATILSIGSIFFFKNMNFSSLQISKDKVNEWVIGGIPAPIIFDVITDIDTLSIFLWGSRADLRTRLKETGVEAKIKNYYRPYFADEVELETHVDQILYKNSGYYNRSEYTVNDQGDLNRKEEDKIMRQPQNSQGLFNVIRTKEQTPNVQRQLPNNNQINPQSQPFSKNRGLFDTIRPQ